MIRQYRSKSAAFSFVGSILNVVERIVFDISSSDVEVIPRCSVKRKAPRAGETAFRLGSECMCTGQAEPAIPCALERYQRKVSRTVNFSPGFWLYRVSSVPYWLVRENLHSPQIHIQESPNRNELTGISRRQVKHFMASKLLFGVGLRESYTQSAELVRRLACKFFGGKVNLESMSASARRLYLEDFLAKVFVKQRSKLIAYSAFTKQSAQVDSDGYLAQMIASIVLGVPGNFRRGKSGGFDGDLADGTEVKSAYRIEQLNSMEDTHVNFGQITREKMKSFMDRDRAVIVHTSYHSSGAPRIEVLLLPLRGNAFIDAVERFHDRSAEKRPQLQPRLYPDGKRDVLQTKPGHFLDLGARLLARAFVHGDEVVVDKWSPEHGLDLEECLDPLSKSYLAPGNYTIADPSDPMEFFQSTMIEHRLALKPFAAFTGSTQNVGFGNLAQHLVSVVTGTPGTGSGARGFDLEDESEIKLAMGVKGDDLGTEDFPRLNLGRNLKKMLTWKYLYPVRIISDSEGLKVKVFRADPTMFREQANDYFRPGSLYENSANLQYHAPKHFDSNIFTGKRGDGTVRELKCEVLFAAAETKNGKPRPYPHER